MGLRTTKHLHDSGEQTLGARAHVHGTDRQPQGVDANHRSSSSIHAAHSLAAALGQVMTMVVMPRRSSIRMSLDDNGVLCCASFSATNSPVLRPSASDCRAAVAPLYVICAPGSRSARAPSQPQLPTRLLRALRQYLGSQFLTVRPPWCALDVFPGVHLICELTPKSWTKL